MKGRFFFLFLVAAAVGLAVRAEEGLKPRLVVLTDIAPGDVEPDDMESVVRLMAYADQVEIEALIATVGWNCDPYPPAWADYLWQAVGAYEHDVKRLMRRSGQKRFLPLADELGKQAIGYWPSGAYLQSRVVMGSRRAGIAAVGKEGRSAGSDLIVRLADEDDPRPLWIAAWGSANTLAQAIWQVKQSRTADELKAFLHKLRVYSVSDQDMAYDRRKDLAYSSHQWMRREFADDLLFIWDESAWLTQNELGKKNWEKYARLIQRQGVLGSTYPTCKWGVEGDTPSWLHILPNGLHDPDDPTQAGWGGCHRRDLCPDSLTTAWTNWREPQKAVSRQYEERFYPYIFNDFAARMRWAATGTGNRNPVAVVRVGGLTTAGAAPNEPLRVSATAGSTLKLDASKSYDPDGGGVSVSWWIQRDAGRCPEAVGLAGSGHSLATLSLPTGCEGAEVHVVCEVRDNAASPLVNYRRLIVRVEGMRNL